MQKVLCLSAALFMLASPALAAGAASVSSGAGSRLEAIRARGALICGLLPQVRGFASVDANDVPSGFDVDTCRAVSAAIFGTPNKTTYVEARNVAQLSRTDTDIDIVVRRITSSLTRAANNGLMFGPVTFYDGQGFLVPKKSGVTDPKQLNGKTVCVQTVEYHETSVMAYFKASGLSVTPLRVEDDEAAEKALKSGDCAAFSADVSWLGSTRANIKGGIDDYVILPHLISKEPLAPLVRQGDDQFFNIVSWSIHAMLVAEEYGITSKNIDSMMNREELEVQQFLGRVPGNGKALGLDEKWAYNIIKTVGNYAEVFDRNVGAGSPIKLDRGLNKLWRDGGLMYPPRIR